LTKEGFSANIVLTKQQGATMTDKNLINLIKYLQEKVDSLEKEIAQLKGKQND
jgi:hypothetical protein